MNSKILIALVTGLAAGAAIGILFAPEKGTETRDKLNESLANLGEAIKKTAADEIDNLTGLKDKILENIRNMMSGGTPQETNNNGLEQTL